MNFADAIRKVHGEPQAAVQPDAYDLQPNSGVPQLGFCADGLPAPASASVLAGNVVRLELFLSAEQMSGMFRAIMAGQHTVMTAREAAAYLRIGKDTLMKLAEEGEIPGILIDGRWRFPKPNLDDWLMLNQHGQEEIDDVA
ncbi:MAG: helix-turn-helix domain-containing protein [Armatimonadetes bacterium]|nr:helix-turn-helix domain-containing protein [Armatimonadota bacterium]MBS1711006.1 helix-turn-helix domain-containing protein [Armatimonadota bacterium]MBX3108678.1 helix-turn-helix domain-containing protein [Fimbriimonadaceae bacterium]